MGIFGLHNFETVYTSKSQLITHTTYFTYFACVCRTVNACDLDIPMGNAWYYLHTLKVACKDHNVAPSCICLSETNMHGVLRKGIVKSNYFFGLFLVIMRSPCLAYRSNTFPSICKNFIFLISHICKHKHN